MDSSLDDLLSKVSYQNRKKVKEDISKLLSHTSTLLPRLGSSSKSLSCSFLIISYESDVANINGDEYAIVIMYGTLPIYFSSVQVCDCRVDLFLLIFAVQYSC